MNPRRLRQTHIPHLVFSPRAVSALSIHTTGVDKTITRFVAITMKIPAVLILVALSELCTPQSIFAAGRNTYEFGKRSQLQWIVDTNLDGTPDNRINFGEFSDVPQPADYNGDGVVDAAVLRASGNNWEWIVDTNADGIANIRKAFGEVSDSPSAADYDGDNRADFAIRRSVDGDQEWIVDTNRDGTPDIRRIFGKETDTEIAADYDGDGRTDFAVVRNVDNQLEWIVDTDRDGTAELRQAFGNTADSAVPEDYNGDGSADFAVVRMLDGQWEWIVDTNKDGNADIRQVFGDATDRVAPADYNGDGLTDFAVLRDTDGQWKWIVDSNRDGSADIRHVYGQASDLPLSADYSGDGAADLTLLRKVTYINGSGAPQLNAIVDDLVMSHLKKHRIPGATVAISKGGRLVLSRGYGIRSAVENTPMMPHYSTRIGSTTKVVTAAAAMKLTEQHPEISIKRKLYGPNGLLPAGEFSAAIAHNVAVQEASGILNPNPLLWFQTIELAHILSHSAGFQGITAESVANILGKDEDELTYKEIHTEFLRRQRLKFFPGSTSNYDNHHLGTVGHVVETLSKQSYKEYIEENLLEPIGLKSKIRVEDGAIDTKDSFAHAYTRNSFGLSSDKPVPADYTGNGSVDIAVVRERSGQLEWIIDSDRDGDDNIRQLFGESSDTAIPADFDGDGSTDLAVLRIQGDKLRWIVDTNRDGASDMSVQFGLASDIAVAADYDGDGSVDFAVLRREGSQSQWIVDTDRDGSSNMKQSFGNSSDQPLPADYDGDGKVDFAVLRIVEDDLEWIVDTDHNGTFDIRSTFGKSGDIPQPGDYDGDNATDFAVVGIVNGELSWFIDTDRNGSSNRNVKYGKPSDKPMAADFSGNGKTDVALLRISSGEVAWVMDVDAEIYVAIADPLEYPAGGLTAAAEDLVRFMCATDGLPNQADVLSASTLQLMEKSPFPNNFNNRALGWTRSGSTHLSHSGSTKGGASRMIKYLSGARIGSVDVSDVNVAVLFNIQNSRDLTSLVSNLAKEAGRAEITSNFDLFGP